MAWGATGWCARWRACSTSASDSKPSWTRSGGSVDPRRALALADASCAARAARPALAVEVSAALRLARAVEWPALVVGPSGHRVAHGDLCLRWSRAARFISGGGRDVDHRPRADACSLACGAGARDALGAARGRGRPSSASSGRRGRVVRDARGAQREARSRHTELWGARRGRLGARRSSHASAGRPHSGACTQRRRRAGGADARAERAGRSRRLDPR